MFGRRKSDKQLIDAESILTLLKIDQRRQNQHRRDSVDVIQALDELYDTVRQDHIRRMKVLEKHLNG